MSTRVENERDDAGPEIAGPPIGFAGPDHAPPWSTTSFSAGEKAASGVTRREEFPAKRRKSLLQRAVIKPIERTPRDEDKIEPLRKGHLMGAKALPQTPLGGGSCHRVAHR